MLQDKRGLAVAVVVILVILFIAGSIWIVGNLINILAKNYHTEEVAKGIAEFRGNVLVDCKTCGISDENCIKYSSIMILECQKDCIPYNISREDEKILNQIRMMPIPITKKSCYCGCYKKAGEQNGTG